MGVPILRLPVVALKVLLDFLNTVELVSVSLLSKRAEWFLKACGKRNVSFFNLNGLEIRNLSKIETLELFLLESKRQEKLPEWNFKLCCSVSSDPELSISCSKFIVPIHFEEDIEEFVGARRNLKIGGSFVPVMITSENDGIEKMRIFWNDKTDGTIVLLDYFKSNLHLSIEELKFKGKGSRAMTTVVNHINSTQTLVRNVIVHFNLSSKSFKFILQNVSATESFFSSFDMRGFKYNGKIRAKKMYILDGDWFSLQNLLASNENEVIHVEQSAFKKEELRTFLREFQSGKFPKLKSVKLATMNNYPNVTSGFAERLDKSVNAQGHQVQIIRGHGDSYGIVSRAENRFFHMRVHND